MNLIVIGFISIVFLSISPTCNSYKVLVVSPTPVIRNIILSHALVRLLLEAGFEVTHISVNMNRKYHPNLKHIYVINKDTSTKYRSRINPKEGRLKPEKFSAILQQTTVNRLLLNTTQTFDLIIAEWSFNSIFTGLAALYNCPLIWFGTTEQHSLMYQLLDESYSAPVKLNEENERKAFANIFEPLLAMRGKPLYSYDQLRFAASLVLLNWYGKVDSEGQTFPKKFIPIAGFHVEMNMEPLHKSMKRVLDNAKQGFIYISLGMNINTMEMETIEINKSILHILYNLKQAVIWQQEQQFLYSSRNVFVQKWSSQQSVLSHPNCLLFITHGGGLSTLEAMNFGVPMIGLPVFRDQLINIDRVVEKGVAKKVTYSYRMVEELKNAILVVLGDPSYRKKAKQLSTVYRHQSNKAKRDFIYWVNQTIQSSNVSISDMGPLFNNYIIFKSYVLKLIFKSFSVGIITTSALIFIPLYFKCLHSSNKKR